MNFPFQAEQGLAALRNARNELASSLAMQRPSVFWSLASLSPLAAAIAYSLRGEDTTASAARGMLLVVDRQIGDLSPTGHLGLAVINERAGALEAWQQQANLLGSGLTSTINAVQAELGLSAQVWRVWNEIVIPTATTARDKAKEAFDSGTSLLELMVVGAIAVAVIYVARAAR